MGTEVVHPQFGAGSLVDVEGTTLTVLFDEVGYRTLDAGIVASKGLLDIARPIARSTWATVAGRLHLECDLPRWVHRPGCT